MRQLDLNLLRSLNELLSSRSVTQAAATLGISQPTMSGILARLRQQFDDPLLVRVGRQMDLTALAKKIAPEVRQIVLLTDELGQASVDFTPSRLARHFKIMVSEFGLCLALPAVMKRVLEEAPHVTIEAIPIHQPVSSVYGGAADICLTGDHIGDISGGMSSQVRTQTVIQDRLVGMVDQLHPLDDSITMDELLSFSHVMPQFPGSRWTVGDIGLSDLSIRRPPTLRTGSFLAIGLLVAGTTAIGMVPSRLAPLIVHAKELKVLNLPHEFKPIDVKMLWHNRHDQDIEHRWLRHLIAEACANLKA